MSLNTLYVAWQDSMKSRAWFPVGRLDIEPQRHCFRYIRGAERARRSAGFFPLAEFPDLDTCYLSDELFPTFQNRIINPSRPDRQLYLKRLGLRADADPFEILAVNGGKRMTDRYEVFPRLVKARDGSFECRFFLHGWRHTSQSAQQRLDQLTPGECLYLALEITNPKTTVAVQLQSTDYQVLGWAPRYLVDDLSRAMIEAPKYEARVVQLNALAADEDLRGPYYVPTPPSWRVLVEITGNWIDHTPMSGVDFKPLTKSPNTIA